MVSETWILALALLLAISIAAVARNDQVGQGQWCWQPASSTVMFCDFSSYGSCGGAQRPRRADRSRRDVDAGADHGDRAPGDGCSAAPVRLWCIGQT